MRNVCPSLKTSKISINAKVLKEISMQRARHEPQVYVPQTSKNKKKKKFLHIPTKHESIKKWLRKYLHNFHSKSERGVCCYTA
ncbi:hypothetical protein CEXT_235401 [Caerostris extrusa]|uniref:Ribosomal protein S10 n=1 Tax=Caerostris extrusa TaxID=172846 RepID=A0AAV4X6C1_CAEEX|nr:hypothetical protein CEXT_235401 [Caerostris extrusa]